MDSYQSNSAYGENCRQGDLIAAYLFILCAKILAILVKQNIYIKGITINGEEYEISQYTDE
jgi:hypothetical protein